MAEFPLSQLLTEVATGRKGQNTVNFIKTAGGLYVPQGGTEDGSLNVNITGGNITPSDGQRPKVAKSTDPRPPGREGDTLFLWDTKQAFIHDNTEWREA